MTPVRTALMLRKRATLARIPNDQALDVSTPATIGMENLPGNLVRADRKAEVNKPYANQIFQNAIGSRGHADISEELDRKSGMNPYNYPAGDSPAESAYKATMVMVDELEKMAEENQVYEQEGFTRNRLFTVTRERQSLGLPNDPASVDQALRESSGLPASMDIPRATTNQRMQKLDPVSRSGLAESHFMAMVNALGNMDPSATDSLVNEEQPGVTGGAQLATASGVVKSEDMLNRDEGSMPADFLELMSQKGADQLLGYRMPAAEFHPAESNYQDSSGTRAFAGLRNPYTAQDVQSTIVDVSDSSGTGISNFRVQQSETTDIHEVPSAKPVILGLAALALVTGGLLLTISAPKRK